METTSELSDMIATDSTAANNDHGWQKVTYAKRNRNNKTIDSSNKINAAPITNGDKGSVFHSLELQSEDRRRRILEAQLISEDVAPVVRSKDKSEFDYDSDVSEEDNGKVEEVKKKIKPKKPKIHKITVTEASAKIDPDHLAAYLANVSVGELEGKDDVQLSKFWDYFGGPGAAFSEVGGAQFPWIKMFKEATLAKLTDIPVSYLSETVYKTSVDWINQRPPEALGLYLLKALENIFDYLSSQQSKGSKKGVQQTSSKAQVVTFLVIAMILRRKPDVLISVLPTLRESLNYQGQDKLPIIIWMVLQASHGDLSVGLYAWAHNLLPVVTGKSSTPESGDLVLQLIERILSTPKARTILVNGAVRKGERLMPPSALEMLLLATFPASSAKVKFTERFEAIYPTLKEVALAGSLGSKAMKQVAQQIHSIALKAAGESIPELSKEAASIFIWSLRQNTNNYKQWDMMYEDNLEASVAVLKKLSGDWKELSDKLSPFDTLRETLKNFVHKNEKDIACGKSDASRQALVKEADKYCKSLLGKSSRGNGCMKSMAFVVIAFALGAAVLSPNMQSWDLKTLAAYFNLEHSL